VLDLCVTAFKGEAKAWDAKLSKSYELYCGW
jgi:hypothetical protein